MERFFRNKKVLVMGLGLLGGGIATTKWLVKHGAIVTVTDLKSGSTLAPAIRSLGDAKKKASLVLGRHRESDFKENEIIVVNPAVPRESRFLKIAKLSGARLENEASLFFKFCKNPIIGITGTRGKTTTANWAFYLLKKAGKYKNSIITGNSSSNPMLGVVDSLDGKSPIVVELSSWHLEFLQGARKSPEVAIITNLYRDHMNRYKSMSDYAKAKANIFRFQSKKDLLLLAKNNDWTSMFGSAHKKWGVSSKISYFPADAFGISKNKFVDRYGLHNWLNFTSAAAAVKWFGVSNKEIKKIAFSLPQINLRQEVVFKSSNLLVINDSTATSPEGVMAAVERFAGRGGSLVLITGGTDKNLEYKEWARIVKRRIEPRNLFLLNGSATKKMIASLRAVGYFGGSGIQIFENLDSILRSIKKNISLSAPGSFTTILFSPGAASFEKFKNEFDRGEKFSARFKKYFP